MNKNFYRVNSIERSAMIDKNEWRAMVIESIEIAVKTAQENSKFASNLYNANFDDLQIRNLLSRAAFDLKSALSAIKEQRAKSFNGGAK